METLLFLALGLLVLGSGLALSGLALTGVIAVARAVLHHPSATLTVAQPSMSRRRNRPPTLLILSNKKPPRILQRRLFCSRLGSLMPVRLFLGLSQPVAQRSLA